METDKSVNSGIDTEVTESISSQPLAKVAVVDDDQGVVKVIEGYLEKLNCGVTSYSEAKSCLEDLGSHSVDVVITDVNMPEMDGLELTSRIKQKSPATDVIVVTGYADKTLAIQALRLGAFDFFEKPVSFEELAATVKRTLAYRKALRERDAYSEQLSLLSKREAQRWEIDAFIGKSQTIRGVVEKIRLLQNASDTSVLITGESGTGKELVARAIHFGGKRSQKPFIPINCSAVPTELAESTLFGHIKGSFTGALRDRRGCFELANGGTLFLDEMADVPVAFQSKLLRVLEDGELTPVGGATTCKVDVRVIAATNADISERMASGLFREDLYYRLAGFRIHIDPLREHPEDIPLLARHFVERLSAEMGLPGMDISSSAMSVLESYGYPGNVRELRNIIERALIQSAAGGNTLESEHLEFLQSPARPTGDIRAGESRGTPIEAELPWNLNEAEAVLIKRAMVRAEGNVSAAARLLGINRSKLYRKLATIQGKKEEKGEH